MKIAHISDLHFGAHDPAVLEALVAHLIEAGPHLVIASGDITQSATEAEFAAARAFFDALPMEVFVIPGNHDLPGLDLTRFLNPFGRYKRHLIDELNPELAAGPVHIKGINTARRILPHWNWANGAVSAKQRREIARTFEAATAPWRILVLHHPLMSPKEFPLDVAVFNKRPLLETISEQRIDIVLAGHQHHAYIETRQEEAHKTLFVSASTGMSTRLRRQPQGFNLLEFTDTTLRIDQLRYADGRFTTFEALSHTKSHTKPAASL
ncbi:metallophosphoesterase family protein [Asticcacaulis taihuensis]|uniref:metallophosphoesterase family protein n=1 Tax=Asticcacaulis taihuensis TaxID=260084 RepID=UPI0026EDA16C|nr:metallophosphoesterase [Asticcacaulis taihuensis]